ncbi:MAG: methyltransferase domain-containing protein [Clostridia bacterium]|nr:methyltransferase domain-containing protein [Clostridia bacterium]
MFEGFKMICPVCGERLTEKNRSLICPKRHSFDRARQGYVNLLPVQNKHSLAPGDAKDMLEARRAFLDRGYYQPICRDVCDMIKKYSPSVSPIVVDIGCGEGYYTAAFEKNCSAYCIGVDIAKEAARMACARSKSILWTVATASHIPVESGSADAVTAVFSLFVNDEYARILKKGGIFVEVTAGSEHLKELKKLIYEEVFEQHKHPCAGGKQFQEVSLLEKRFVFELDNTELKELLAMTPHSRRMKKERLERLYETERLSLTANYFVRVLQKL